MGKSHYTVTYYFVISEEISMEISQQRITIQILLTGTKLLKPVILKSLLNII